MDKRKEESRFESRGGREVGGEEGRGRVVGGSLKRRELLIRAELTAVENCLKRVNF
jgi:hypothetical protein